MRITLAFPALVWFSSLLWRRTGARSSVNNPSVALTRRPRWPARTPQQAACSHCDVTSAASLWKEASGWRAAQRCQRIMATTLVLVSSCYIIVLITNDGLLCGLLCSALNKSWLDTCRCPHSFSWLRWINSKHLRRALCDVTPVGLSIRGSQVMWYGDANML